MIILNNKKAVVFDLDGTLLDTLDDLADAVNYIMKKYGYPERSTNEVRRFLGSGAAKLIELSLPVKLGEKEFNDVLEDYKEYYKAHSTEKTRPYDGVLDLLDDLKKMGIRTAVVSNKPDASAIKLCKLYFGERIDFAVGDRDDIARKPSADPVLMAIGALECEKAVFVGDSEVDVETAKNAGLPCVSLTWGFRDRDFLEERGAYCFADNADEIKMKVIEFLGVENDIT